MAVELKFDGHFLFPCSPPDTGRRQASSTIPAIHRDKAASTAVHYNTRPKLNLELELRHDNPQPESSLLTPSPIIVMAFSNYPLLPGCNPEPPAAILPYTDPRGRTSTGHNSPTRPAHPLCRTTSATGHSLPWGSPTYSLERSQTSPHTTTSPILIYRLFQPLPSSSPCTIPPPASPDSPTPHRQTPLRSYNP